ncbi:MAG TPA: ATP-grasp domain-containing protein [Gemmatimonadales bacterium]|nr:ATP-grasp domain-containing protein [Gemmatimonadales bacterium]
MGNGAVVTGQGTPALVIGGGITVLGAVRALGRAGVDAYAACPPGDHARRSRWYRALALAPWDGRGGSPDPALLEALPFERAVLIPCSDQTALWVAGLDLQLRRRFPSSTPTREVFDRLVDKARFADLLDRAEVPHPFTRRLTSQADLTDLESRRGQVIFLKPVESQAFFRRFGVKAFHVRDRGEAESRWHEARAAGLDLVLQEYIPGPATAHVFIDGFRDRTGVVRAWFPRRRLRMFPPDFGNSSAMVSLPIADARPAVDDLSRLLEHLEYRGVFSAEFKWDERDGRFKLLEVNARAWWYVEYAAWCGVNVLRLAWLDALEQPVPDVTHYRVGKRCVYPSYDSAARRAMPPGSRPGLLDLYRSWIGARQPVFQLTDPLPGVMDLVSRMGAAVGRRVRG